MFYSAKVVTFRIMHCMIKNMYEYNYQNNFGLMKKIFSLENLKNKPNPSYLWRVIPENQKNLQEEIHEHPYATHQSPHLMTPETLG
jgi:hypothetical protein